MIDIVGEGATTIVMLVGSVLVLSHCRLGVCRKYDLTPFTALIYRTLARSLSLQ